MSERPGKPSPAVYRRRRLVALLVLILLVLGIWWLVSAIVGLFSGGEDAAEPAPTPVATESAPAETPESTSAPEETEASGEDGAEEPEATPEVCTESDVTVTAVVDAEAYGPEESPQFSVELMNESDQPCIIDIGTASQVYTVMSGEDTIWVSTHCQTDEQTQVVELTPDKKVTAPAFEWSRERSSEDTCEDENRPEAVADGAYYYLTVKVGGITSAPAYFALV
ncbi:hypothetical protein [Gulosibacter sp. 10]|uniref:hypothetical protein n=1 Tax=Gulosibacter sp. 10 TaxID=1255570 RepID=UPI00111D695B|nr:hypothetical protein [Gulosibacter sp. 10]